MPNFGQIIKRYRDILTSDRVFMPVLIVLVGTASFGLGRLSAVENRGDGQVQIITSDIVTPTQQAASVLQATEAPGTTAEPAQSGKVVGSKNGTKYHFPWCSGAQRITEANKVWFESIEAAKTAGYSPASNCKGLE